MRQSGASLIGLLDPHRVVAGFVGRTAELGELLAWCADGQDAPVRLVIGPGGVGKTRLAVEFAHRMRLRGWRTEWLGSADDAPIPAATVASVLQRKSLIIIDEADRRYGLAESLADLLRAQPQARILLLARDAGAWCDQVELAGPVAHALVTAARLALIELTSELDADLTDHDVAALGGVAFAGELQLPSQGIKLAEQENSGRHLVLDLHLVALTGTMRPPPEPVSPDAAAAELLSLEREFWASQAGQANVAAEPSRLGQSVAAGLLLGPGSEEWLARVLSVTWPSKLARLHIGVELSAAPEFARQCLSELDAAQLRRALPLLTGQGKARPPESALRLVASQLERFKAPNSELIPLLGSLPYPDAIWADAGAALCGLIVRQLTSDTDLGTRAYWLNTQSARLWLAGRQLEAVGAAEEAVALRRDLAADEPERYLASLAISLSYLGIQYAGLGRADDALKVTEEAVAVRRQLAATDPERYAQLADEDGLQRWR